LLIRDIDDYPEDGIVAGPINFGSQVGMSTLPVAVGHDVLSITLEVFPAKIDYETDYAEMLWDVSQRSRALALEYLRATYRQVGLEDTTSTTELEWLTILRAELTRFARAVDYINQHPHRALIREPEMARVDGIRRVVPPVRRAILRGQGKGRWLQLGDPAIRMRERLPSYRTHETLDTPEQRWIRFGIATVIDRLAHLSDSIEAESLATQARGRAPSLRLKQEGQELRECTAILGRLVDLPVFEGIAGLPPAGFSSLTLLSAPGYREAYRSIVTLRLGLNVEGDSLDASIKDLHVLYETWCYIKLVTAVGALPNGRAKLEELITVETAGLRVRLKKAAASEIVWEGADRKIVIAYNPQFPGPTGMQKPDVILRFEHPGWPDIIVVFDAKYRLDRSQAYTSTFGVPGPPVDALGALHRYRDAILLEPKKPGTTRPVVKGVALYPLSKEDSADFESSRLYEALGVLGIGALPFLPSNTELVEEWLRQLLALQPADLANPGPPFAAWEERRRREVSVQD
jgi:predicted component of viral defense system (DUF524 family)